MITQIRLDERYIHGQVATAWTKYLGATAIVVANDELIKDQMAQNILKMGCPTGVKLAIKSIDDAITLLSDPRADKMKVLLLVSNPHDAWVLAEALDVKEINCANYVTKKAPNKTKLEESIYATPEDLEEFRKLVATGRNVYCQVIPSRPQSKLQNI